MALIFKGEMRAFPPRLPEQPIFYPVLAREYADQIARDWNTKEAPHAGYVLRIELDDDYAAKFEPHIVGGHNHRELWVPAEELDEFNRRMSSRLVVERAFFGSHFRGHIPESFGLRGADAFKQLTILIAMTDYSLFDFVMEVSANSLTFFLNYPFWKAAGAGHFAVDPELFERCLDLIRKAWSLAPRPAALLEEATCAA